MATIDLCVCYRLIFIMYICYACMFMVCVYVLLCMCMLVYVIFVCSSCCVITKAYDPKVMYSKTSLCRSSVDYLLQFDKSEARNKQDIHVKLYPTQCELSHMYVLNMHIGLHTFRHKLFCVCAADVSLVVK